MNSMPCHAWRVTIRLVRPAGAKASSAATRVEATADAPSTNVTAPTPVLLALLSVVLSNGEQRGVSRMGLPLMLWMLSRHHRSSARQSVVMRTAAFQLERLSLRERAPAREAMTLSIARVRTRVAVLVASHVEATRSFSRAIVRTPADGGTVSSAVTQCRIHEIVAGGTRVRLCGEVNERAERHEGALRCRRPHALRGVYQPAERLEDPLGGVHCLQGRAGRKENVI